MVDEYQDTNTAQFKFVSLLASKYENLCVVGDDDQSIYKFRGANIGNILGFEHVFPDAKVIRLEQNYRSTKNFLSAANEVIAINASRKSKTLWTENPEGDLIHFRQFMNGYEEAEYVVGEISRAHRENGAKYKDCAVLYRTAQSLYFAPFSLCALEISPTTYSASSYPFINWRKWISSPSGFSVQSVLDLREALLAITSLAALRMFLVER